MTDNGIKSSTETETVNIPLYKESKLATGIVNNSYYKDDLELKKAENTGIIRYEIETNGNLPDNVSVFSPLLPDKLDFRVAQGESINFNINLKEYRDYNDRVGGNEQNIHFTIDKQAPAVPQITGITNNQYYLLDQNAGFKDTADKIFYKVTEETGNDNENFTEYKEPFSISSPEGTFRSYSIKAYSQDFAGNKSNTENWTITIDKEIIYVSNEGHDYSEGTRSRPYLTINKAVEQVKKSKRKTIFIASGEYIINSPVVIDESITVYGGFNKNNWYEKDGETIVKPGKQFPSNNPVFYIYGGDLNIGDINISADDNNFASIFSLNKGNLNINNSRFNIICLNGNNFIKQDYGKLYINNSELNGSCSNSTYILVNHGVFNINNSVLTIDSVPKGDLLILQAKNCINITATSTTIKPGRARNIETIKIEDSNINIKNCRIESGIADISSKAIETVNSKLKMNYCNIVAEPENRMTLGISAEDTDMEIFNNNFSLNGTNGVIGFELTGGTSLIDNNNLKAGICSDFSDMFIINGGKHSIETNISDVKKSSETEWLRNNGGVIDLLQNTIVFNGEAENLTCIKHENDSVSRIINNIIINNNQVSNEKDSLVFTDNDKMLSLKNNCFNGWTNLVSGADSAKSLIELDLIDGIYSGGRFSDNIEENTDEIFIKEGDKHLSPNSKCIDSGYNLSGILSNNLDFDGEKRPNPLLNREPAYDIGIDEYYE